MILNINGTQCEVTDFSRYEWKFNIRAKKEYMGSAYEFLLSTVEENNLDDCSELIVELKQEQTKDGISYYYEFSCKKEDGMYYLDYLSYYSEG